jgi:hypothetical protein
MNPEIVSQIGDKWKLATAGKLLGDTIYYSGTNVFGKRLLQSHTIRV